MDAKQRAEIQARHKYDETHLLNRGFKVAHKDRGLLLDDNTRLLTRIEHMKIYCGHKRVCESWKHSDYKCDCGYETLENEIVDTDT